ncbi:hypothetical protein Pmani_023868 [Petrolisthes manimaculis]|uniref:Uncharacterized protein n=1 Tax=Petrolisthes manimaculis TaxID=1843537 RepID=A0AAE1U2V7_9EUCA|nr:hypothetical protein Pmani_023868 [Petrolisthes manimaculis]
MDDVSMPELNNMNDAFHDPQVVNVPCPNTPALTAAVSQFCNIVNEMNNPNFVVAHRPLPRKGVSEEFTATSEYGAGQFKDVMCVSVDRWWFPKDWRNSKRYSQMPQTLCHIDVK